MAVISKSPSEAKAIEFDFREFVQANGNAVSCSIGVSADGLVIGPLTHSDGMYRVLVSGGVPGRRYVLGARVLTTSGQASEIRHTIALLGPTLTEVLALLHLPSQDYAGGDYFAEDYVGVSAGVPAQTYGAPTYFAADYVA